jgi:hypothetical protein
MKQVTDNFARISSTASVNRDLNKVKSGVVFKKSTNKGLEPRLIERSVPDGRRCT